MLESIAQQNYRQPELSIIALRFDDDRFEPQCQESEQKLANACKYWMEQADYYNAAYQKLYREALERRKPKRQESTKPPPRASRPMTRARQSTFTKGTAQGSVDKSQCAAASSRSPYEKANGSTKEHHDERPLRVAAASANTVSGMQA
ncbi:MAG: hypothetical protein M1813_009178 [Trichoglossum hirsutum]|nr:MAG: hypothetical protein M1813_009178 [Trichoglossum hirsutum]